MPDARAEVIPNTGHLVFLEAPQIFDTLVLDFLAKSGFVGSRSWPDCSSQVKGGSARANPAILKICLQVAEATAAEGAGVPAGRAIVHRAAAAIGAAMLAGATAAGHADKIAGCGLALVKGREPHGLRRGHRHQAEAQSESRNSKQFHRHFLSSQ